MAEIKELKINKTGSASMKKYKFWFFKKIPEKSVLGNKFQSNVFIIIAVVPSLVFAFWLNRQLMHFAANYSQLNQESIQLIWFLASRLVAIFGGSLVFSIIFLLYINFYFLICGYPED